MRINRRTNPAAVVSTQLPPEPSPAAAASATAPSPDVDRPAPITTEPLPAFESQPAETTSASEELVGMGSFTVQLTGGSQLTVSPRGAETPTRRSSADLWKLTGPGGDQVVVSVVYISRPEKAAIEEASRTMTAEAITSPEQEVGGSAADVVEKGTS